MKKHFHNAFTCLTLPISTSILHFIVVPSLQLVPTDTGNVNETRRDTSAEPFNSYCSAYSNSTNTSEQNYKSEFLLLPASPTVGKREHVTKMYVFKVHIQ